MTNDKDELIKLFIQKPHILGQFIGYDLLSDIHSNWIKYCWLSKGNISLQAHRNSYKTTAILVVGTIWYLMFYNPDARLLFVRKSWEEAASIVNAIKLQYESDNVKFLYDYLFDISNFEGNPWKTSALSLTTKIKVTPEPNLSCKGVGANLTGGHYEKILADDIITIKDRISVAERKTTTTFVRELNNIPVIKEGTICFTGTPWHKEDTWQIIPKPKKYPIGTIEIEGLTPEKIKGFRETSGASLYAANYELKHVANEDQLFPEPIYDKWPGKFKRINAWIDPSYEGKATTAMAMILIDTWGVPFVRGWVWHKHVINCYKAIINNLNLYNCGSCFIETNADKGFSQRDLSEKRAGIIGRNESMNKHIKIISFLKQNWTILRFAEDCQPEFVNQIMDYNEDADLVDAPDALASLIREMRIGKKSILDRF